jgi:crossover junction endodeoxyribonuclease RuvC
MQSKPDAIAASGLLFAENRTAFHIGVSAQGNVFDLSCGRKAVALPAFLRASRRGLVQGYKMTARLFCTKRIHFLCAVCTGFVVSVWGLWYNNSKSAACAAMCMDAVFAAFGRLGAAQEMGGRAMRILGIDPGYAIVGFGALDYTRNTFTTLQYGAITTKAHTTFEDRLSEIYDDMTQLLAAVKPDAMAIETLFYTTNQKTVIAVAEARGVLLLCARQAGVPVFEYTPLQVKQSVSGYGKATKKQVQEMTRTLLKLPAVPKPDDTADALAMAICHAYSYRSKQYGVALTKRQQMGYF